MTITLKRVTVFYVRFHTGNGVVDFGEFVNMMINQNNNTLDEKELLEAFRTFDGDDKGYIFSNEIRYVMRHMGESIPEQDINEILQDHEDSRKRKITFEGNKISNLQIPVTGTRGNQWKPFVIVVIMLKSEIRKQS